MGEIKFKVGQCVPDKSGQVAVTSKQRVGSKHFAGFEARLFSGCRSSRLTM